MTHTILQNMNEHICTLTLNEPNTKNAISNAMIEAIVRACDNINNNPTIAAVILNANGSAFCAGGNVKEMIAENSMFSGTPDEISEKYRLGIQRIPQALLGINVPVVCAIQGAAIGAGMDMSLCADMRLASEHAFFAHSFTQLGLISGDGGHWLLERAIGYSKACELSLTGKRITAQEALSLGLVNAIYSQEDLNKEAFKLADDITKNPREALIAAKQLTRFAPQHNFEEAQHAARDIQGLLHNTSAHKNCVNAIVQRISKNPT